VQLHQEETLVATASEPPWDLERQLKFYGFAVTELFPKAVTVDLKKDIARFPALTELEQLYLVARYHKLANLVIIDVADNLEKYNSDAGKVDLIGQLYSDSVGPDFPPDIGMRFEWYKKRKVREFEKKIVSAISMHQIKSPIEKLFLMEWMFQDIDHVHGVLLEPHKELKTPDGVFEIDFVVSAQPDLMLAIEIDGHDFHEKTRAQVSRDKARERFIVRAGYTILRFSGSEVYGNPRKCVSEILDVIKRRKAEHRGPAC